MNPVSPVPEAAATEGCVLVVDDDRDIRELLVELVEVAGCAARAAANGAEALKVLASCRPCLIILDLMMPIMTGVEFLAAMRAAPELAGLSVVISTSTPERAPSGFVVVPKPIDVDVLWGLMRRACHCAGART